MDPQQELFTELLLKLKEMGYDVYDTFLPPEDTRRILSFLLQTAGRRILRQKVP